jgi:hypothetical protein
MDEWTASWVRWTKLVYPGGVMGALRRIKRGSTVFVKGDQTRTVGTDQRISEGAAAIPGCHRGEERQGWTESSTLQKYS